MTDSIPLKYRPRQLADLVGQTLIKTALSRALEFEQIASAYLFTGARGTGKTSTARILAKSLNCLASDRPTPEPCGRCAACRAIEVGSSLDVTELDAASHNGVNDARDLIEQSSFAPVQGRYRVLILDEFHMMTTQATNALLKTLEEPPRHVVFILCTTEFDKILPTIVSRCQVYTFRALAVPIIAQHLQQIAQQEGIAITGDAVMQIARQAQGGMRDALQLLGQLASLRERITIGQVSELVGTIAPADLRQLLASIRQGQVFELLQLARNLAERGTPPLSLLATLIAVLRDLLLVKADPQTLALATSSLSSNELLQQVPLWQYDAIELPLKHLQQSEAMLRHTSQVQVWWEVVLLGLIPTPATVSPPRNGKGHPAPDLDAIWQQVMVAAKPTSRSFLAQARLVSLKDGTAVLRVAAKEQERFERNATKIGALLQKVLQRQSVIAVRVQVAVVR